METQQTMPSAYTIKWAIIAPCGKKSFSKKYKSALKKAGFTEIYNCFFAAHFNSESTASIERIKLSINKLKSKINGYKKIQSCLSFIITDKQMGLIATEKAKVLSAKNGWVSYPIDDECNKVIPVTYNQMYAHGSIVLRGSQATDTTGLTFDGSNFNRIF